MLRIGDLKIVSLDPPQPHTKTYLRHLKISKLVPEILNGVQPNQSGNKQSNPFDTAHTSNRQSGQDNPEPPLEGKRSALEIVEPRKTEHSREGKKQEHGVEQDKSTNGSVRVFYTKSSLAMQNRTKLRWIHKNLPHSTINVTNHVALVENLNSFAV